MSYKDGWAAINLEMPDRVPRQESSADSHWELVTKVTGIEVNAFSDGSIKEKAQRSFYKAWNYDYKWNTCIFGNVFGEKRTSMGHAVYASEGVDWNDNVSEFYDDPDDALNFDPWELYGSRDEKKIITDFNNNYAHCCEFIPDAVNMTGVYITCMSGLIDIFGWDMLLTAAGQDPDKFGDLTNRYVDWILQYFNGLAKCDAPVVMVHDDFVWTSGGFMSPAWYRKYLFPSYKRLFKPLIENGKKILFTSDGNYTEYIDDVVACGINGIQIEPTTDMGYFAEKYGKTHVFVGNADTRILLSGTKDDIYAEVKRCMDIGKKCPGFFMAVGNHIPANTPVENALYYNDVYEKLSKR
ncbi:hypothetical protein FACS1894105_09520 [Clostridia bacterium]|nr:hypothetical protein FACS1894105_09520 [Clostridia bacterium]